MSKPGRKNIVKSATKSSERGLIEEVRLMPNLDPEPWVSHHGRHDEPDPAGWDYDVHFTFAPRPEYSQDIEDYR